MDRLLSFSPEPFELHFEFEGTLQMPIAPKCGYCGDSSVGSVTIIPHTSAEHRTCSE